MFFTINFILLMKYIIKEGIKMSEEIIKVLNALAEKFGLTIDWSSKNVIPYSEQLCHKYVNYEIATSIMWIVLGILLCTSTIICFKIVYKHKDWGVFKAMTM